MTLCSFPLGKARMGLSSGNSVGVAISQPRVEACSASTLGIGTKKDSNSVGVALSRRRYRSRKISGTAANNTIINNKQGDTKTQKAVVTAVGFAWVCLSVTPVGKRVFLLIVATIPTVMHGMTTAATTIKKAAVGRSKSPPLAVQKQQFIADPPNSPKGLKFIENPSLALPKGGGIHSCCVCGGSVCSPFLGEGSAGGSLGRLVTYVTWSRINCYVLTCLMSRALVSNVTSRRGCTSGGVEMPLRDAHRPSTASTSAAIDIHTVRYRHRYRTMRMAREGRDDKEENLFSDGRCHQRHQGEAASRRCGFLCFVVTLYNIRGCGICHWTADFPAAVTPSANRNSYRVATIEGIITQGRGAAPLNPGL